MEKRDNIEVRLHKDGTLDEIVICDPHNGNCLFHLEQMSDQYYWMRAYGVTQDLVVQIGATAELNAQNVEIPKVWVDYEWENSTTEAESGDLTPIAQRQDKVAEIINTYGARVVLQDIVDILKAGGQITDLENCIKLIS